MLAMVITMPNIIIIDIESSSSNISRNSSNDNDIIIIIVVINPIGIPEEPLGILEAP